MVTFDGIESEDMDISNAQKHDVHTKSVMLAGLVEGVLLSSTCSSVLFYVVT